MRIVVSEMPEYCFDCMFYKSSNDSCKLCKRCCPGVSECECLKVENAEEIGEKVNIPIKVDENYIASISVKADSTNKEKEHDDNLIKEISNIEKFILPTVVEYNDRVADSVTKVFHDIPLSDKEKSDIFKKVRLAIAVESQTMTNKIELILENTIRRLDNNV